MNIEEIIEQEKKVWTRSAPADLYYQRDPDNPLKMRATSKLEELCSRFEDELIKANEGAKEKYPPYKPFKQRRNIRRCKGRSCKDADCMKSSEASQNSKKVAQSSSGSSSSSEDESEGSTLKEEAMEWLLHRQNQPFRLHQELWENQKGEANDGPTCRCSNKAKKIGIRHGVYQGETDSSNLESSTNNYDKLYHYRITISPPTNFLIKKPTVISHDSHDFIFEGFSLFTTKPLKDLPICNVLRFNIKYSILYLEEKVPDNFT